MRVLFDKFIKDWSGVEGISDTPDDRPLLAAAVVCGILVAQFKGITGYDYLRVCFSYEIHAQCDPCTSHYHQ